MDYSKLLEFCATSKQTRNIEAIIKYKTKTAAAKALGLSLRGFLRAVKVIEARANVSGGAEEGFFVKGKSILTGPEGETKLIWTKTEIEKEERHELLMEAVTEVFSEYKGTINSIRPLKSYNKDLLNILPLGDPHLGMYAYAAEAGDDFNCEIAERDLITAFTQLMNMAPTAETCIILNLGDFFHADNSSNTTLGNKNPLDVDGRYNRVLQIGVKIMIACIEMALKKHKKVVVRNNLGNHDYHSSQVLSIALSCFFSKNKRVHIDTSPNPFWYFKFGKCLFGSVHGDKVKPANLPLIMAADQSENWGNTTYRYWHTGHIHHQNIQDFVGCTWESHATLAASDAWHTSMGYRSKKDIKLITYHRDYGEESRFTLSLARIRK